MDCKDSRARVDPTHRLPSSAVTAVWMLVWVWVGVVWVGVEEEVLVGVEEEALLVGVAVGMGIVGIVAASAVFC